MSHQTLYPVLARPCQSFFHPRHAWFEKLGLSCGAPVPATCCCSLRTCITQRHLVGIFLKPEIFQTFLMRACRFACLASNSRFVPVRNRPAQRLHLLNSHSACSVKHIVHPRGHTKSISSGGNSASMRSVSLCSRVDGSSSPFWISSKQSDAPSPTKTESGRCG